MNYLFLTPLYNDWDSLRILLRNLNNELKKKEIQSEVIVVNDCSTKNEKLKKNKLKFIKKITILNLKKNLGSQKAIFLGLKYIKKRKYKGILTILDSDGEDDVKKTLQMITHAKNKPTTIILARRSKRLENIFLRFLNKVRLFINYILIGNSVNFGNFSSFNINNLKKLLLNNNLFIAYPGGILKNYNKFFFINSEKKLRYSGATKVNFFFLICHSINILSIFWKKIALKSCLFFLFLFLLFSNKIIIIGFFLLLINFFLFLNFKKNYKKSLKINFYNYNLS